MITRNEENWKCFRNKFSLIGPLVIHHHILLFALFFFDSIQNKTEKNGVQIDDLKTKSQNVLKSFHPNVSTRAYQIILCPAVHRASGSLSISNSSTPIHHAEEKNTRTTCDDPYPGSILLCTWAPSRLSGSFTSLSQRYSRRITMGWELSDGCYGWKDGWMNDDEDDDDDDRQSWWWQPIIKLNYTINEIIGFKKERVRYLIINIRTKFI